MIWSFVWSPLNRPRQQKQTKQLRRSRSHFCSCNLAVKLMVNINLFLRVPTCYFNNFQYMKKIHTCSTNLGDFPKSKVTTPELPDLKTTMATHQWLTLSAHRKARLFRPEICTRREANIAAKCEASFKHIWNTKTMNLRSVVKMIYISILYIE